MDDGVNLDKIDRNIADIFYGKGIKDGVNVKLKLLELLDEIEDGVPSISTVIYPPSRFVPVYAYIMEKMGVKNNEADVLMAYTKVFAEKTAFPTRVAYMTDIYKIKRELDSLPKKTAVRFFLEQKWGYDKEVEAFPDGSVERDILLNAQQQCTEAIEGAIDATDRGQLYKYLAILSDFPQQVSGGWKKEARQEFLSLGLNINRVTPRVPPPEESDIEAIIDTIEKRLIDSASYDDNFDYNSALTSFESEETDAEPIRRRSMVYFEQDFNTASTESMVQFDETPIRTPVDYDIASLPVRTLSTRSNYRGRVGSQSDYDIALKRANAYWKKHPKGKARDMANLSKRVAKDPKRFNPSRADWPGIDTP